MAPSSFEQPQFVFVRLELDDLTYSAGLMLAGTEIHVGLYELESGVQACRLIYSLNGALLDIPRTAGGSEQIEIYIRSKAGEIWQAIQPKLTEL